MPSDDDERPSASFELEKMYFGHLLIAISFCGDVTLVSAPYFAFIHEQALSLPALVILQDVTGVGRRHWVGPSND